MPWFQTYNLHCYILGRTTVPTSNSTSEQAREELKFFNVSKSNIENKVVPERNVKCVLYGSDNLPTAEINPPYKIPTFESTPRQQICLKEGSNSSTSVFSEPGRSNNISLKQNGFKLGKDAFRQSPAVRIAKFKEQTNSAKINRDISSCPPTKSIFSDNPYEEQFGNHAGLYNANIDTRIMPTNKMDSCDIPDLNKGNEKVNEDNSKSGGSTFDGKGPIGFDAAFQRMYENVGPGSMGFGENLSIVPRLPGTGGFNNARFPGTNLSPFGTSNPPHGVPKSANTNLEPIAVRKPPKKREGPSLFEELGVKMSNDDKEQPNTCAIKSEQPSDSKKAESLPSLLDIEVKLPPPINVGTNMTSKPPEALNVTNTSFQNNEDIGNTNVGINNIRSKGFTPPTLRTSVTFGPQRKNVPTIGAFGAGLLNKPYGFDKGPPNTVARPPQPTWFGRPSFVRPSSTPDITGVYGNQGPRFTSPMNYTAQTQGTGNFQPNGDPIIYNEQSGTSPNVWGQGEYTSGKFNAGYQQGQIQTDSLIQSGQSNMKRPTFDDSEAGANETPTKKITLQSNLSTKPNEFSDQSNGYNNITNVVHNQGYNDVNTNATSQENSNTVQGLSNTVDKPPVYERVRKVVTPLWNMPISVQLDKKNGACNEFLGHLKNGLVSTNQALNMWFQHQEARSKNGLYVENKQILASPLTDGYRNKCDFVIGINPETKLTTVGFLIEQGTSFVGPVGHLSHISEGMKYVALELGSTIYITQR